MDCTAVHICIYGKHRSKKKHQAHRVRSGRHHAARLRGAFRAQPPRHGKGAGILVVPATGRVRNFIPPCLTELPFIRYAITSNGGAVWDILENKVLCTDLIPTETALEVQKIFDERDILVYIYTINDKEEARRYLANGAQGVCTDVLITDNLI